MKTVEDFREYALVIFIIVLVKRIYMSVRINLSS